MKNILFVIAMDKEAIEIAKRLELEEIHVSVYKLYRKENINLIITGIGKQRTAISLTKYIQDFGTPDIIINVGYAGSTDVKIGSWINVNQSYNYEWQILNEERYSLNGLDKNIFMKWKNGDIQCLPCYSAESFVTHTEIKESCLFDMELHSINIICQLYQIELISLKMVSDNLSIDEYYKNLERKSIRELTSALDILDNIIK